METIKNIQPTAIWKNFDALNAVPRPSKKEEKVIEFMLNFGKNLNLETIQDRVGNVIIKKPATPGMENRKTVVIQSHLDMVHQKNNDTVFDFETQGIEMYVDGDWVRAKGTTLGADNGLGVATAMALLESTDVEHPALEALFTIDEETGMTGALELQQGLLDGEILLNMDTEEDDELTIGCAGGVDTTVEMDYSPETKNVSLLKLKISGLNGGHSGMDIDKGLGNANLLMNQLLLELKNADADFELVEIDGGGLRNAIPRESVAVVGVKTKESAQVTIEAFGKKIKTEFAETEPNLAVSSEWLGEKETDTVPTEVVEKLLNTVQKVPNGVYAMSKDIKDLVETSSNLARVKVSKGKIELLSLQRSSVEAGKQAVSGEYRELFESIGANVIHSGDYPGWEPIVGSPIVKTMQDIYRNLFNDEPKVMACHAGLECGIIGERYPQLEMVSYGPTIRGAHSPDERASISSTQKFWKWTLETLKNIPVKEN